MITFDASPTVYWALVYAFVVLVIGLNLRKRVSLALYLPAAALILVLMRLPALVLNRELNADESQMISHAITLFQHPVYWRSVDGTTIGPLDNYLLAIPRLLGFQLDYVSARVMGLLCGLGALYFYFVAIRRWFGNATARISLLIPLIFLAFTQELDFVHYSSEQVPLLLLSLCLALVARISIQKSPSAWPAFGLGFVAGMIPFAKVQAVPQALVLVLGGLYLTYQQYRQTRNSTPLLVLLVGGIIFLVMALLWMLANGVFQDFIDFYILGNAVYAAGAGLDTGPSQFGRLVLASPDFTALLIITSVVLVVGLLAGGRTLTKTPSSSQNLFISLLLLGYGLAAVYAATKSGNVFVHYLNFCIYPLALASALGVQRVSTQRLLALVGPMLLLGWFGLNDAISFYQSRQLNALVSVDATTLLQSPVVKALAPYTRPNDQMVVWGWQCRYYVEAQLAQGTAENHSGRDVFQHPMRDQYRERYLSDMRRNRPAIFLDAVGKNSLWLQNVSTQGHEVFPALATYVAANYQYIGDVDGTRLYVRNDRVSAGR
ncbi:hypothetical protein [Salmonirosea aquatica]|uniref:Glycosyltransferase RgtA/B/C/D-like domain-containing protein n=1 Tax=Salmonirosea aquatica TaxID=2654236 RepID=A0A7C9BH29_9BACT|nr:hypothetical protein [Cytophagaceae bacterium SJW1-29]